MLSAAENGMILVISLRRRTRSCAAPPPILSTITRLDTLRTPFNENLWLEQEDGWVKRLLVDGHVPATAEWLHLGRHYLPMSSVEAPHGIGRACCEKGGL